MRFNLSRRALAVMLAVLIAGCASAPPSGRQPRTVAIVVSGDVVAYGAQSYGTTISIVDVDGTPVTEPYGPVEMKPGRHIVTLKCDGATHMYGVNALAGEVYQFAKAASPGARGCTASLKRMRTTNP